MDKLTITFTRPTCMVLDMLFENYTDGFFKYILNYTYGKDGLVKKSEEACDCIEEAVSEFSDAVDSYVKHPMSYYWNFCMEIDKWDRVVVFLRNLNFHTVALLASTAHGEEVPFPVAQEYLDVVRAAYRKIILARENKVAE